MLAGFLGAGFDSVIRFLSSRLNRRSGLLDRTANLLANPLGIVVDFFTSGFRGSANLLRPYDYRIGCALCGRVRVGNRRRVGRPLLFGTTAANKRQHENCVCHQQFGRRHLVIRIHDTSVSDPELPFKPRGRGGWIWLDLAGRGWMPGRGEWE
jgi:hypothetical protein